MHRPVFAPRLALLSLILPALLLQPGATLRAEGERAEESSPDRSDLFESAPPRPRPRTVVPGDEAIRSRRPVRVRRELLQAPAAVTVPLRFNLFPGTAFTGVPDRDECTADGDRVITGTLAGVPGSSFLLVMHGEDVVADVFVSPLERYQLRREPGEDSAPEEVRRLDPRALPPCAGTAPAIPRRSPGPDPVPRSSVHPLPGAPRPHATAEADPGEADDPGTFDVLIAYTPAARAAAGGIPAIETLARFAVEGANQRYANSGITTRARLVRTLEVPYAEAADGVFEDLHHLIEDGAGPLTEVRAARDAATADVACLFVAAPVPQPKGGFFIGAAAFAVDLGADGQPCGVPELGFSVVMPAFDVATTFAHEIGHNFGCQHDVDNVVFQGVNYGPGIFPFSYGYRFTGPGGQQFRDVMAYEPGVVIPYFSNPQVLYSGVPTGTATADNARTINATAPLIANLRVFTTVSVSATQPEALERPLLPGRFTLTRTGTKARTLTVNLITSTDSFSYEGRAVAGGNYQPLPTQVIFPAGAASVDIPVVPIPNDRAEGARPLQLILLPGEGYRINPRPGGDRAAVRLRDTLTTVSIAATVPTAFLSPPQPGRFTFTRTGPLDLPLTVRCSLNHFPEDPRAFVDQFSPNFVAGQVTDTFTRTLTIPAGSASVDVDLTPSDSAPLPEGFRLVGLTLHGSADYLPGSGAAYVVVARDPDGLPPTEFALTVLEPDASLAAGRSARLLLTRVRGPESRNAVLLSIAGSASFIDDYDTDPGMAGSFGAKPYSGGVFLQGGESSREIVIRPKPGGDLITQTVSVALAPNSNYRYGATLGASTATVHLLGLSILTATTTGPEARATSDLGPVNGEFTLHREGDLSQPLTVRYNAGGTAVAGNCCKAFPGVATFPAGQDFVRVKVKPKGNAGGPGAKANVKLTLQPGDGYLVGSEARAKVKVFGGG